jgi:putative hydrolase of HD superfamily
MFEGERRGYDVDKLIKLALLHDMEEAITGDLTPEDKASKGETVVKNEKVLAREKLLSHFPKESQSAYKALWAELEQANNREANLVHELDKLEMALQANEYARKGIEATKLREFYISSSEAVKDPQLRRILVQISVPE